jgi:hypothetical protein
LRSQGNERWWSILTTGIVAMLAATAPALAETMELRGAKQNGLGYLQMMLIEDQKFVE